MNNEKLFDQMAAQRPLVYASTIFFYFFGALSLAQDVAGLALGGPSLHLLPAVIGKLIGSLFFAIFLLLSTRRRAARFSG